MLSYFLFSVIYEKPRCAVRFFRQNVLNARGILARGIYNARTMFRQFSGVGDVGRSRWPSALGRLVTGGSQPAGISCPKESQSYLPMKKII